MGAESLAEGIRTCALLALTTVAITDRRRYLCPAPSGPGEGRPAQLTVDGKRRAGQQLLRAAAMREMQPTRNHRRLSELDTVRRQLYSTADADAVKQ